MRRVSAAGVLALLAFAVAAQAAPRLVVEPAFDTWRSGDIAPLRVQVANDGPAATFVLEAQTARVEGRPQLRQSLELAAGARKAIWIAPRPGGESIEVRLRRGEDLVASSELQLRNRSWAGTLVGTLADPPARLAGRIETFQGPGAGLSASRPDLLPDDPLLWPALDVLVWPAPLAHELTPRQARALGQWVRDGGRLIAGSNPEDPQALVTLGLLSQAPAVGRTALGWGAVDFASDDLRRSSAGDWWRLLDLSPEPPSARRAGPVGLRDQTSRQLEGALDPPFGLAVSLLGVTLLCLIVQPWSRARRAANGRADRSGRWPLSLTVIALATAAAFAIAHFGAGRGRLERRLDIVDVDIATGHVRGHSVLGVRRASAGLLHLDAEGDGRLQVSERWIPFGTKPPADVADSSSGDQSSCIVEVSSWETRVLEAHWRADSVRLPDLTRGAEALARSLGAEHFALKDDSGLHWREPGADAHRPKPSWPPRWLGGARAQVEPSSPRQLAEGPLFNMKPDEQWRWPARRRWAHRPGERVLVAISPGRAAPPIRIDGREDAGEAWTIWRLRLPEPMREDP